MKKIITLAAVAATLLVACNKEQSEPVKKVIDPSGIVLLSVPEQVVAGDSVAIRLRVNPSTARLTVENLVLDCLEAKVYDVVISESEQKYYGTATKSSDAADGMAAIPYVQEAENYSITRVVPDTLNNQPLEGQYIVTVKAQSERNIIDQSTLALVCCYQDENGDAAYISTGTFTIPQIPQPSDAVFAWSPQSISLHAGSIVMEKEDGVTKVSLKGDCANAAKWYLVTHTYKNAATGASIRYDYKKYIGEVTVQLEQNSVEIACKQEKSDFGGAYSSMLDEMCAAVPDVTQEPYKTLFENGSDKNYETFTNKLTVTDKFGHAGVWSQKLNVVVPLEVYFNLDVPEDVVKGEYEVVDKDKTFAEYGIDTEMMAKYPSINLATDVVVNVSGLNFYFLGAKREDGFGIGRVLARGGAVESIKSDVLCSRIAAAWYVRGPGAGGDTSDALGNFINLVERLKPAGK